MKIIAIKNIIIELDKTYGSKGYINVGDEFDVYPTNDGVKFMFCGQEFSPYDFLDKFKITDED